MADWCISTPTGLEYLQQQKPQPGILFIYYCQDLLCCPFIMQSLSPGTRSSGTQGEDAKVKTYPKIVLGVLSIHPNKVAVLLFFKFPRKTAPNAVVI